jgi:hypothetical protein
MKTNESEESLAVGCSRFCVLLVYVIFPRVPQRASLAWCSPRIPTLRLSPAADQSPLSGAAQGHSDWEIGPLLPGGGANLRTFAMLGGGV